jgi:hypothetical protein
MRYLCLAPGALALLLVAQIPLQAQYPPGGYPPGGYPPGTYPPGRYPGGGYPGGVGMPIPGRGKQKKTTTTEDNKKAPLQSVTGMLRQLDDKSLVVEAQDTRIINLKRTAETKFYKDGQDLKPDVLRPGDHILIEYRQDDESFLYAVRVNFQKVGTLEERTQAAAPVQIPAQASQADDDRPILRRKDAAPDAVPEPPKDARTTTSASAPPAEVSGTARPAAEPAAEPAADKDDPDLNRIHETSSTAPFDESDPGPPRPKRGKPSPRKSSTPTQVAVNSPPAGRPVSAAEATPPPSAEIQPVPISGNDSPTDPRIEKARLAVASFTETLPSYVCKERMARFVNTTRAVSWQPQDVVSVDVVYENGRENYRNLEINGKAVKKKMEELSGAWSTGEFGTVLVDLFSPATAADFRHRKDSRSGGRDAYVYDFEVDHEHSHWHVSVPSQSVLPAYRGSVWIDKETGRILRVEMQARHIPQAFPMDKVELATDYEYVRIGEGQFLLPVHAETLSCQRDTDNCSRNTIDFRNYHKYAGEATITFEK